MQRAFKLSQTVSRTAFKTCVASTPKVNVSFSTFTATSTAPSTTSNSTMGNLPTNNNSSKNNLSIKRGNINSFGTSMGLSLIGDDNDDDGG